jgi:hypothetical protein
MVFGSSDVITSLFWKERQIVGINDQGDAPLLAIYAPVLRVRYLLTW